MIFSYFTYSFLDMKHKNDYNILNEQFGLGFVYSLSQSSREYTVSLHSSCSIQTPWSHLSFERAAVCNLCFHQESSQVSRLPVDHYAGADGIGDAAETQTILTKTKASQRAGERHREPVTNHRRYRLRLATENVGQSAHHHISTASQLRSVRRRCRRQSY